MNTSAVSTSARSARVSGVGLQVQHDAALAAIDVDEHATHARRRADRDVAGVIALRRLDFDHVGAHVGHDLGAVRSHHHGGEVDHPNPGQRACPRRASHGVRLDRLTCAPARSCSGCARHGRRAQPEKPAAPLGFESHRDVRPHRRPSTTAGTRPGLSAMTARATRPASAMNISPLTEQDSCASQPTTGATRSGPIGG